jgi:hypothetical protein
MISAEIIGDDNMPAILIYWGDTAANVPQHYSRAASGGMNLWRKKESTVDSKLVASCRILMARDFDMARVPVYQKGQEWAAFGFV